MSKEIDSNQYEQEGIKQSELLVILRKLSINLRYGRVIKAKITYTLYNNKYESTFCPICNKEVDILHVFQAEGKTFCCCMDCMIRFTYFALKEHPINKI